MATLKFGNKLEELMDWKGYSQKELSEACGISRSMISGYIIGTRTPTLPALEKLAVALDVSIWALLNGEPMVVKPIDMTKQEQNMVGKYRSLTNEERKVVDVVLDALSKRKAK